MQYKENTITEMEILYKPSSHVLTRPNITSSAEANKVIRALFNQNSIACQEEFIILYLNQGNKPTGFYKMGKGGISSTVADIRLIMGAALKSLSTSLILSHNHPSGNLTPSKADLNLTKQIKEACKIFDIQLLDHLIISPLEEYYSFSDDGVL